MNNKGFSLIELLAVLVILSIVISVAIVGVNGVSKSLKEKQRENLIARLESAASKYAFDTNNKACFVEQLIKEGYIDSDKNSESLADPTDVNAKMDCYVITMEKVGDYFRATFTNNKYETRTGCNYNSLRTFLR